MVEFQPDLEEAERWSSWQHILKNLVLAKNILSSAGGQHHFLID